jgi:chitin synthase
LGDGKLTIAYNGKVVDLTRYTQNDKQFLGDAINQKLKKFYGRDISHAVTADPDLKNAMNCLSDLYLVGVIDATDSGCFMSNTIVIMSMIILFCLIFAKFAAAVTFNWILSSQLGKISRTRLPHSHVVLLVTCYSESEDSLKTTLDSLSATDYNNEQKLLFVIADGNVTGSGNPMSTPDLCKKIMLIEDWSLDPYPMAYEAIGDGPKRINVSY